MPYQLRWVKVRWEGTGRTHSCQFNTSLRMHTSKSKAYLLNRVKFNGNSAKTWMLLEIMSGIKQKTMFLCVTHLMKGWIAWRGSHLRPITHKLVQKKKKITTFIEVMLIWHFQILAKCLRAIHFHSFLASYIFAFRIVKHFSIKF